MSTKSTPPPAIFPRVPKDTPMFQQGDPANLNGKWLLFFDGLHRQAQSAAVAAGSAPNTPLATATVSYVINGNGPQNVVISGTITIPTLDPNYALLARIEAVGIDPTGNEHTLGTFSSWPATGLNYSAVVEPQPLAVEIWSVVFRFFNAAGVPTASPFTITPLTVTPATISALAAVELIGLRYADQTAGLHAIIQLTPTVSEDPMLATFWFDFANGNGWVLQGDYIVSTDSPTVQIGKPAIGQDGVTVPGPIWVPTDPTRTHWKAAVIPGYSIAASPPDGAIQTTFTVAAVGVCLPTDVTNAVFIANPTTGDIRQYALYEPGIYVWNYYEIDWTQPTLAQDQNYWFSLITVQKGYSIAFTATVTLGNQLDITSANTIPNIAAGQRPYEVHVAGVLTTMATWNSPTEIIVTDLVANGAGVACEVWLPSPVTTTDIEGTDEEPLLYRGRVISQSGTLTDGVTGAVGTTVQLKGTVNPNWTFPPALKLDGSVNLYRTFRFRIMATSRLGQLPTGNTGVFTLQTCWAGLSDHFDVTPDPQAQAINLGLANPTFFDGSDFKIVGGKFTVKNIDMLKALNLSAQFQVVGAVQTITNISATLIMTGLLQVGGYPGMPSQIKVFDTSTTAGIGTVGFGGVALHRDSGGLFDASQVGSTITVGPKVSTIGTYIGPSDVNLTISVNLGAGQSWITGKLIAFIGDDSANSGYVGAWFLRCRIGGTVGSPNFFADPAGNVVCTTVSLIDNTKLKGFIGLWGGNEGIWVKNGWFGGTGVADALVTISGAMGAINASTIVLNLNSVTTSINSAILFGDVYGTGLTCSHNTLAMATAIGPGLISITDGLGFSAVPYAILGGPGYAGGYLQLENAAGHVQVVLAAISNGSNLRMFSGVTSSTLMIELDGTNGFININGANVLTSRRTGPGNPTFAVLADAQAWCQWIYNNLKVGTGHGLVT